MTPSACASVPTAGPGRLAGWCAFGLALVALACCLDTLGFDFVARDDDINLYFNPHLGPPGADSLAWMFTDLSHMRRYGTAGGRRFPLVPRNELPYFRGAELEAYTPVRIFTLRPYYFATNAPRETAGTIETAIVKFVRKP